MKSLSKKLDKSLSHSALTTVRVTSFILVPTTGGFRKPFFPIRNQRILSCAGLGAFWRCSARCLRTPSSAYEALWTHPPPPAAPSLVRCCLWYGKTCRQPSPAGGTCPAERTARRQHSEKDNKERFRANVQTCCVFLRLSRIVLPCIVAPLWGSSHLSAPQTPGNEDLSHLLSLLQHHS